jgi:hypothetical protein
MNGQKKVNIVKIRNLVITLATVCCFRQKNLKKEKGKYMRETRALAGYRRLCLKSTIFNNKISSFKSPLKYNIHKERLKRNYKEVIIKISYPVMDIRFHQN